MLSERQIERYSRQLVLPFWGLAEQQALASSVIGVDERLLSAALYLAAAGVGELRLFQISTDPTRSAPHREELRAHLFGLNADSNVGYQNFIQSEKAIDFAGEPEKFLTDAIVKVPDGEAEAALQFAQTLEAQGTRVLRWLEPENNMVLGDRRIELPQSRLLSADLTAGTIAASMILQSIAGFANGTFPDRFSGNFGCSVG